MALGKFSTQAPLFLANFLPHIHLNGKDNNHSNKTCSPNPITRENSSFSFLFVVFVCLLTYLHNVEYKTSCFNFIGHELNCVYLEYDKCLWSMINVYEI